MEFEMLTEAIVKVMKIDKNEISTDMRFVEDLGADSLDLYQIAMTLEEIFDIRFNEEDLRNVVTVQDAYELIKNH